MNINVKSRPFQVSFVVYQLHNQLIQAMRYHNKEKCDTHIRQLLNQQDCPEPLKNYYREIAKEMGIDLNNSLLNAIAEMDVSSFEVRKEREQTSQAERLRRLSSELNLEANAVSDDYDMEL